MSDNDEQDFEAAFAEATKGDTAGQPDPQPAPEAEQQAAEPTQDQGAVQPPAAPEANQSDIWANAPPELRSAYEAERQRADRLEHMRRSDEGRVAAFQRQRDDVTRQLNVLTRASSQEDLSAYIQSDDWKKAKEEYGSDLGPVFKAFEAMVGAHQQTQEQIGTFGQFQAQSAEEKVEAIIESRASDWKDLLSRADFDPWLKSQPPHVQALYEHNQTELRDPEEVLDLVGKFRAHVFVTEQSAPPNPTPQTQPEQKPIDQKRAVQLEGSRSVQSRQPEITADEGDFESYFQQAARQKVQQTGTWR